MELAAAKQLSLDFSCTPQDFFKNENTVTVPAIRRGRRVFSDEPPFFRAATMGMGAVICASADIAEYTRVLAKNTAGTEIFTASVMSALNRELFSHGCCIGLLNQYYVPAVPYRPAVRSEGFTLRVFDENNIAELFEYKGFDNALLYRTEGERRDIIAVCAFNGRSIMGSCCFLHRRGAEERICAILRHMERKYHFPAHCRKVRLSPRMVRDDFD